MKKEKINIAEILINYPKGTQLWSAIHGKVLLDSVDDEGVICCSFPHDKKAYFFENGTTGDENFNVTPNCCLWPDSKRRDWLSWEIENPPFKKHDCIRNIETGQVKTIIGVAGDAYKYIDYGCIHTLTYNRISDVDRKYRRTNNFVDSIKEIVCKPKFLDCICCNKNICLKDSFCYNECKCTVPFAVVTDAEDGTEEFRYIKKRIETFEDLSVGDMLYKVSGSSMSEVRIDEIEVEPQEKVYGITFPEAKKFKLSDDNSLSIQISDLGGITTRNYSKRIQYFINRDAARKQWGKNMTREINKIDKTIKKMKNRKAVLVETINKNFPYQPKTENKNFKK